MSFWLKPVAVKMVVNATDQAHRRRNDLWKYPIRKRRSRGTSGWPPDRTRAPVMARKSAVMELLTNQLAGLPRGMGGVDLVYFGVVNRPMMLNPLVRIMVLNGLPFTE